MNEKESKTYICFNDESGNWSDKRTKFYIRSSLIVNSCQIKTLEKKIIQIRENLKLNDLNAEIKWQDLWNLRTNFINNQIPKDKRLQSIFNYLKSLNQDYHLLIKYCKNIINLLQDSYYDIRIILSFTEKTKYPNHKEQDIAKFHIQNHLQRLQMQYSNSIVLIIYDSIDEKRKTMYKKIHKDLITNGDFIKRYSAIFDTLLFDDSYDNKFLQVTDFIAGSFSGTLTSIRNKNINNYQKAVEFFATCIYPRLCKTNKQELWGAGILEVPTNNQIRYRYKKEISKLLEIKKKMKKTFSK